MELFVVRRRNDYSGRANQLAIGIRIIQIPLDSDTPRPMSVKLTDKNRTRKFLTCYRKFDMIETSKSILRS